MNKAVKAFRGIFAFEWTWRSFLCLQILGIAILVYVDVRSNWSAFPDFTDHRGRFDFDWDFVDGYYWTRYTENWTMLACLLAPFLLAKALDWICSSQKDSQKAKGDDK